MYQGVFVGDTAHRFDYRIIAAYLRYQITVYNSDAGIQAAYGHKQFGFGDLSVQLGVPPSINFSAPFLTFLKKYYGEPLTVYC